MSDRVLMDVKDWVAHVRLARPDRMNAIDTAMFEEIGATIDSLASRADVRCVVLSGDGRGFCAGLDMENMKSGGSGLSIENRNEQGAVAAQHVSWGWRNLPVPVIAAVHGVAFGGGFQIMSGVDIRIAAPATRFSIREVHWGLVPDMAGFALWKGTVRDDALRKLVFTAREFDSEKALSLGFITEIADDPLQAALDLAREIAGRSPDAVQGAKRLANLAQNADDAEILRRETTEQALLMGSPAMREVVSANLERRPPIFPSAHSSSAADRVDAN